MPTPSSNTPPTPPELPSRTHSSSCPEDVRSPSSWSAEEDGPGLMMYPNATTSPGLMMYPDAATPPELAYTVTASPEAMGAPTTTELLAESRLTTESPQPDSHSATDRSASETVGTESPSHKLPDELGEEVQGRGGAAAAAAAALAERRCELDAVTADHDKLDDDDGQAPVHHDKYEPAMGFNYSNVRIFPMSPSSFLRPGSKFHGQQTSERQKYDVQVEIKYVDLRESFLCGYLKIQGLTEFNPTLTTYFEGEIIGSRYDFLTKHEGWGANDKIDLNHWSKFSAFRQYNKQVRKGVAVSIPNLAQRENIFMRWKEHFLVPDHRVTSINGASFEGFYYICFNQKEGKVSGIYFHSKSEKFQQLELEHVADRGCFGAVEFR
ncbi:putative vacuolar import and degradation protein [Rosellinia necatrix]|uniref:Putative vacuolar import and degradation protein n=1 Tax=Rosellinia necatrix TaxID=77044 RepID=A0A1W2TT72_ROSNE|nr:putative vacuolar import and degradation protein [Rosellinia necatrix]